MPVTVIQRQIMYVIMLHISHITRTSQAEQREAKASSFLTWAAHAKLARGLDASAVFTRSDGSWFEHQQCDSVNMHK